MPRVAIVGGGLAGTAAATMLAQAGVQVDLFERRSRLGGRAASFYDPIVGRYVDHCPHVLMGCCTEAFRFYQSMDADQFWRPLDSLRFVDRNGRVSLLRATPFLPAPLHLGPAFAKLRFLSPFDRMKIAGAVRRIPRRETYADGPNDRNASADLNAASFGYWLRRRGQSDAAMEKFWNVVLRGALAASCDEASCATAMKVFRDAFLTSRKGHVVYVPRVPLSRLHHEIPLKRLQRLNVNVRLGGDVREILPPRSNGEPVSLRLREGRTSTHDAVVVATPWRAIERLLPPEKRLAETRTFFERHPCGEIPASAITAIHVWLDRPLCDWDHAVLIDDDGDWMFRVETPDESLTEPSDGLSSESAPRNASERPPEYHYVLVRSGTSQTPTLAGRAAAEAALNELLRIAPRSERNAAAPPRILHWRFRHHPRAVFAVHLETEAMRPPQKTSTPGVYLAGDATRTGWPGTIEGAVRSGRAAAESLLNDWKIPIHSNVFI